MSVVEPLVESSSGSREYVEELMKPGTRVEVRSRFDDSWGRGFEIVEASGGGYRVRRLSDGAVLPVVFEPDDVRKERKKQSLWWY